MKWQVFFIIAIICTLFVSAKYNEPELVSSEDGRNTYNLVIGDDTDYNNIPNFLTSNKVKLEANWDTNFPLLLNKVNITDIDMDIFILENYTKQKIPIKIYNKSNESQLLWQGQINENRANSVNLKYNIPEILGRFDMTIFDIVIHFGYSSTIISFDYASSDIVDCYVSQSSPTTNYDTDTPILIGNSSTSGYQKDIIIKFGNSRIPENLLVLDAELCMYISTNDLDSSSEGYNISTYHFYNQTWSDTSYTWNTKPSFGSQINVTSSYKKYMFGGTGEPDYWQCFNVTDSYSINYKLGYKNFSLYLMATDLFGTPSTSDYISIYPVDFTTTSRRPVLNVTYEEIYVSNNELAALNTLDLNLSLNVNVYTNTTWFNINNNSNITLCYNANNCEYIYEFDSQGIYYLNIWSNDSLNNVHYGQYLVFVGNYTKMDFANDEAEAEALTWLSQTDVVIPPETLLFPGSYSDYTTDVGLDYDDTDYIFSNSYYNKKGAIRIKFNLTNYDVGEFYNLTWRYSFYQTDSNIAQYLYVYNNGSWIGGTIPDKVVSFGNFTANYYDYISNDECIYFALMQSQSYSTTYSTRLDMIEAYIYFFEKTSPLNNCTYISGDWIIPCSDNCNLSVTDLGGNDFYFYGAGTIQGLRNITNYQYGKIYNGCYVKN